VAANQAKIYLKDLMIIKIHLINLKPILTSNNKVKVYPILKIKMASILNNLLNLKNQGKIAKK